MKTMKRLLSALLSLALVLGLMPGMSLAAAADTTVTWSSASNSFDQSIVSVTTLSGSDFEGDQWEIGGSFTTSQGVFKQIVISGGWVEKANNLGSGWSGATWTGSAATVPFSGRITDGGHYDPFTITFTIEGPSTVAVEGVNISPNTAQTITVGQSVTFNATVSPDGATDQTVKRSATGGVTVNAPISYPLWVGGVQFKSDNLTIDGEDDSAISGKAEYDASTNTLTLTDFSYTGPGRTGQDESGAIDFRGGSDLKIVLVGANSITKKDDNGIALSHGIYFNSNQHSLIIEEREGQSGSLTIGFDSNRSGEKSNGIFLEPGAFVMNSGTVVSNAGRGDESAGIFASNGITFNGGSFEGNGYYTTAYESRGIYSYGNITVNGGTVTGTAPLDNNFKARAFDNGTVTINGGDLTAYGKVAFKDTSSVGAGQGVTIYMMAGESESTAVQVSSVPDEAKYARLSTDPSILPHAHSFTYSADGATITATCTAGCPDNYGTTPATLTIAAEGGTYDGTTAYSATVTNNIPAVTGDTVGSTAYYKVDAEGATTGGTVQGGAPTGAGYYYASVTLTSGSNTYTAVKAFTVAKATATVPTDLTATYGQTLANVTLPDGWTWVDSTQSVGNVVSPAATFKANFAGDDNYNAASNVDVTVTVSKAANPATVTNTASVTKGGSTVDLANNVTKNDATGDVTYAISGEANGCSLNGSVLTSGDNTGSVTVNVTVAADNNYNALAATPITVTINKANAVPATVTANNRTYDGTEKPLVTVTGEAIGGEMQYALGENATTAPADNLYTTSIPTATDAGTYYVWYMVEGDTNHVDGEVASVKATIAKASVAKAKVTLKKTAYTYDGKAKEPAVKSVVLRGVKLKSGTDYTVSYKSNKNPGTATATVTGKGNYKGSAKATFTIKLAKARLKTVGKTAKSGFSASWSKVAGAKSYQLQWRKAGGKWKSVSVKGTSRLVAGLKAGGLYQFRVRAVAGKAKGAWSGVSGRYLAKVKGVKATVRKPGAVTATWQADPEANAGYVVVVRYDKGGKIIARASVAKGKTSATVKGLKPGKGLWVEVRPVRKSDGKSYVGVLHGTWAK